MAVGVWSRCKSPRRATVSHRLTSARPPLTTRITATVKQQYNPTAYLMGRRGCAEGGKKGGKGWGGETPKWNPAEMLLLFDFDKLLLMAHNSPAARIRSPSPWRQQDKCSTLIDLGHLAVVCVGQSSLLVVDKKGRREKKARAEVGG